MTPDPTLPSSEGDLRAELAQLSASLRAHLDHLAGSGAYGVPRGRRAVAALESQEAKAAAAGPGETSPPPNGRPVASPSDAAPLQPERVEPTRPGDVARLAVIQAEARACTRCGLHATRNQSVFSRGTGSSGLVFVGEGPGEEEDRTGFPFVGAAGQLLDKMIGAMQLGRDEVYVCNIVKCRPPRNRKPDPEEMSRCMPFLAEQITIVNPKVIVALGATAVQGLLGTTEGIMRLRGQWKLYRGKIPVMPTFHPAYLLREPQAKREVWKDLQDVLRQLGLPAPSSKV